MSTMSQSTPSIPLVTSPVFWGLLLICIGTAIGASMIVISPQLTHAINVGMVMVGSAIILASSGTREQS